MAARNDAGPGRMPGPRVAFYVEGNGQTDGLGVVADGFTADPSTVTPEPASVALLATGLLGVLAVARRRKN